VWLDPSGKQLLQWPIEEVEALRAKSVTLKNRVIKAGHHVEVTGIQTAQVRTTRLLFFLFLCVATELHRASCSIVCMQADVEVSFEVSPSALAGAETLDPALAYDAERLCGVKRADVRGGVGPFGLWVLASANRKERTAVFFRVFKPAAGSDKPVVLMCTDPTK
jgi:beta-fructofuranosidase